MIICTHVILISDFVLLPFILMVMMVTSLVMMRSSQQPRHWSAQAAAAGYPASIGRGWRPREVPRWSRERRAGLSRGDVGDMSRGSLQHHEHWCVLHDMIT